MFKEVRWERMFRDELEQAFSDCPLVYFPYGLCEPHGPQNALGCDSLRAHAICRGAAREHGGIVAPVNYWHVHGCGNYAIWGHEAVGQVDRTWLTCVPPWMFFKSFCYHVRTAEVMGFHGAVFFSGHGGPHSADFKTIVDLVQPHVGTRLWAVGNDDSLVDADPGIRGWADHAGRAETSSLWAVEPACADPSRLPDPDQQGQHFAMHRNVYEADRRTGQQIMSHKADWLGRRARDLLAAYDRQRPAHTLRTFEDVENLWDQVVRPRFSGFDSMQDARAGRDPMPADSVWYENWRVPDRA